MGSPPNILLLWTDAQRADTLTALGNRRGIAPCLDALAADSTVFERAYCTMPMCTPSRGSVLTGRYPREHGAVWNGAPLRPDVRCISELLPGYECAHIGKWHLGDEVFPQRNFSTWISTEDRYIAHYSAGRDRAARSTYHHWLLTRGHHPDTALGTFSREFVSTLPEAHSKPRFQADCAVDFIRGHARSTRPWFLSVSLLEPHPPFHSGRDGQHDPGDVDLPLNARVPPDPSCLLRTRVLQWLEARRAPTGCRPDDETSVRQTVARYWGLVSLVDHHIGRILNALRETGQWESTVIVFTSDHGMQLGSHAMVGQRVLYEESLRVPLLIKPPGRAGTARISTPVSLADLVPTLLDYAGAAISGSADRSLRPAIETGRAPERDVVVVWHPRPSGSEVSGAAGDAVLPDFATAEAIRNALAAELRALIRPDGWKLIQSSDGAAELYHLPSDTWELHNRIGDRQVRDQVRWMRARLSAWCRDKGDLFVADPGASGGAE